MQLAACNRIAPCLLEMLRVACSVKLFHANRIAVYSLQHVAWSFKGFTGKAATEHLGRHGDYSETQRFYGLASVGTKMAAFSWTVEKIDALQVRRRRFCRYWRTAYYFYTGAASPYHFFKAGYTSAAHVPPVPCPCSTIRIILYVSCTGDRSARVQYIRVL